MEILGLTNFLFVVIFLFPNSANSFSVIIFWVYFFLISLIAVHFKIYPDDHIFATLTSISSYFEYFKSFICPSMSHICHTSSFNNLFVHFFIVLVQKIILSNINTTKRSKVNQPSDYDFLVASSIIFTPQPLRPRLFRCRLFNYPFLYWNRSHIKFLKEADYLTILYYWFLPAVTAYSTLQRALRS